MSLTNKIVSINPHLYINYEEGLEEYRGKISSLIDILENEFTQGNYDIDFQLVYTKTHEICLNRMSKELYSAVRKMLTKIVVSYYSTLIKLQDSSPNQDFYSTVIRLFKFYKTKINQLGDALSYMERINIKYNQTDEPLAKKGMQIFYQNVLFEETLKAKYKEALIRELSLIRQGKEEYHLNEQFELFYEMLIDKTYGALFYSTEIFPVVMSETWKYYDTKSLEFKEKVIKENNNKERICLCIIDMIKEVSHAIEQESQLMKLMDDNDRQKILGVIFERMIIDNYETITKNGMKSFFKTNDINSFSIIYRLFFNYQYIIENNGTNDQSACFYTTIHDIIEKRLKKLGETFITVKEDTDQVEYFNFQQYIDELCCLKKNCALLLVNGFNSNIRIEHIIKASFEKHINKSSHFLKRFIKLIHEDIKLSLKIRNAARLTDLVEKFPVIFKLINDKDLFEEEYRSALGKRLIRNTSMIKETECSFFSIMKKESGQNYVKKIENMINDICFSRDINLDFRIKSKKEKEKEKDDSRDKECIDFYTKILSQENWPMEKKIMTKLINDQSKRDSIGYNNDKNQQIVQGIGNPSIKALTSISIILPIQLEKCIDDFTRYYINKFKNRFITFIHELSWGEIYVRLDSKLFLFIVSTFQLTILMLFNSTKSFSKATITSLTSISLEDLSIHLYPLTKIGILTETNDSLTLNKQFNAEHKKIDCNYIIKPKKTVEKVIDNEINHMLIEDRKHQLDSAIIHLLKTYKRLPFDEMKSKIIENVSNYFVPEISFIKGRIDNLIDRNFIERDEYDLNVYVYIA